jgi:hypothetical protein
MNPVPKFAEVHEKAQAMRKRMTQQSTELAIEKNRRAIAGIAQSNISPPEINNKYAKTLETFCEYEFQFDVVECGEIPAPNVKPI